MFRFGTKMKFNWMAYPSKQLLHLRSNNEHLYCVINVIFYKVLDIDRSEILQRNSKNHVAHSFTRNVLQKFSCFNYSVLEEKRHTNPFYLYLYNHNPVLCAMCIDFSEWYFLYWKLLMIDEWLPFCPFYVLDFELFFFWCGISNRPFKNTR